MSGIADDTHCRASRLGPTLSRAHASRAHASRSYDRGMDAQTAFDHVAAELSGSGATTGKLFGHPALKLNGAVFASEFYGAMAFKLGRETSVHAEALMLDGATLFDPSRKDRPFRDWVEVPATSQDQWPMLAMAALDHLVNSTR